MNTKEKETTLEIKEVMAVIRRRKWLLILPLLLVTVIAFAGSFLLETRYQSSTMIAIGQSKILSKQLQAMIPGQEDDRFSSNQMRNKLIAIHNEIISSSYLMRLVDELGMTQDPEAISKARAIYAKRPDVSLENWVYYLLIEDLRKNIQVDFNGEDIVEITVESSDPQKAMDIATKVAEIFKSERLNRELSGARGGLDFSDEQVARYKTSLDEAEQRKADFETEYLQNQLDESITADTNLHAIIADIDNLKVLIEDNIKDQGDLRSRLSAYKSSELNIDFGSQYEKLKTDIFDETHRLATFMSKYIWSDPKVVSASLRINNMLQDMETLVSRKVDDEFSKASREDRRLLTDFFMLQAREQVLREKQNDFEVSLATLRARISRQPQYEIQLHNLEQEVISAREIYDKFKDQATGSEISQSLMRIEAESKYRVVEPASVPLAPVKPNRVKVTLLGAILGLVIGGVAVLLAELLDNSFRKVEDIETTLDLTILATIPNISSIRGKVKAG